MVELPPAALDPDLTATTFQTVAIAAALDQ